VSLGNAESDLLEVTPATVAAVMDRYGFAATGWEPAAGGIENVTLFVTSGVHRRVLRVYRQGARTDAEVALELSYMNACRRRGLPIPQVVPTVDGRDFAVLELGGRRWLCVLMEFAAGRHPAVYTPRLLDHMAVLQARMHLVGTEYLAGHGLPVGGGLLRARMPAGVPDCELLARAASFTVDVSGIGPLGMCHLDYDCDNILVDGDQVSAILDFGDAACQPVVVCLGNTLWDVAFEAGGSAAAVDDYLAAYDRVRRLSPAERDALPGIVLVRHYVITVVEHQLGLLTGGAMTRATAREQCLLARFRATGSA
jgi:Ser/Thr protein kinase RdoA (MazF antagonist)